MGSSNNFTTLLAAASVIALSVGMDAALADDTNNNGVLIGLSKQNKTDANQVKGQTTQHKGESYTVKMGGSQQIKGESHTIKMGGSQQIKGESYTVKMGGSQQIKQDSNQIKGNSVQQKLDAKSLNPQPEPPG